MHPAETAGRSVDEARLSNRSNRVGLLAHMNHDETTRRVGGSTKGWSADRGQRADHSECWLMTRYPADGDGYAISVTKDQDRNRVSCDNTGVRAGRGLSTVDRR